MNRPFILETAVESKGAALAAERGGADRIELCANLRDGGITPSLETIREVRNAVKIPVHVIIRPRGGDFVYSAAEFAEMKDSIRCARETGMNGVALGILRGDKTVDVERTKELINLAGPMQTTFHRAFDDCDDLFVALEAIIATGATRVLTAGGARGVPEGVDTINQLVERAGSRITILPGGGIQPGNFAEIRRSIPVQEFHSGLGTVMAYGSESFGDFEVAVRALRNSRIGN